MEQWMPARCLPARRPPFFPAVPFPPVDGFVRTLDAIRLECWTGSDQNAGRHHLRTPGRLPLESAAEKVERPLRAFPGTIGIFTVSDLGLFPNAAVADTPQTSVPAPALRSRNGRSRRQRSVRTGWSDTPFASRDRTHCEERDSSARD